MLARTRFSLHLAVAAGLVLGATARPAMAQQSLAPRTPVTDVAVPTRVVGPTVDAAAVAVRRPVSQELRVTNAAARRGGHGRPVALMVVGGAALLAGLIISSDAGTAIAVGGAIIGLYGLYEYLQ